jgi:hypothetical protein
MGKTLQSRQEIFLATYVLNAAIAMKTLKTPRTHGKMLLRRIF